MWRSLRNHHVRDRIVRAFLWNNEASVRALLGFVVVRRRRYAQALLATCHVLGDLRCVRFQSEVVLRECPEELISFRPLRLGPEPCKTLPGARATWVVPENLPLVLRIRQVPPRCRQVGF